MKSKQTYRPANNRNYQLTRNGSFQLKRFPAFFRIDDKAILYRVSTFAIKDLYFETILN